MPYIPWWIKVIVGIGGLTVLFWFFDLWNQLMIVLSLMAVPLAGLSMLGIISDGFYEAYASGVWLKDLKTRTDNFRQQVVAAYETNGEPSA